VMVGGFGGGETIGVGLHHGCVFGNVTGNGSGGGGGGCQKNVGEEKQLGKKGTRRKKIKKPFNYLNEGGGGLQKMNTGGGKKKVKKRGDRQYRRKHCE